MALIRIKKGLDIPIDGVINDATIRDFDSPLSAIDLHEFSALRLRATVNIGDTINQHDIVAEEKDKEKRVFRSPFGGTIRAINYFGKRRLDKIVIERSNKFSDIPRSANLWEDFFNLALFPYVRMRPFGVLPIKQRKPDRIFIKALESAPFEPPAELQLRSNEHFFQRGIDYLSNFAKVELIHKFDSTCTTFTNAKNASIHQAQGPHPIANPSVHIEQLWGIDSPKDTVWTCDVLNTIMLGKIYERVPLKKIVALAGPGIKPECRAYYNIPLGTPLRVLLKDKLLTEDSTIINGNPLTGYLSSLDDYVGHNSNVISVLLPDRSRQPLHFFRLNAKSFTQGHTYLFRRKTLTSNRCHGELRAFVLNDIYDTISPLRIPIVPLIKSLESQDFDSAILYGLLEVVAEDFALPSFVCPSKIDMMGVINDAIDKIYNDYLYM